MKKNAKPTPKLALHKTTLRTLAENPLRRAAAGDYPSNASCTWCCDSWDSELYTSCNHCGEQ